MNITLIQFAVQSIVRLSSVSRQAAEQRSRNETALLPGFAAQEPNPLTVVNGFFTITDEREAHVKDGGSLAEYWDGNRAKTDPLSVDALYIGALRVSAEEGVDFAAALIPSGESMIRQFDPGKGPLSPFARIALTAADIVLDYIAVDPGIASDNPNSQKLIAAFARNLADFLPDNGDYGPREKFAERLAGGFLRAGLAAISSNPKLVVDEEHFEKLLGNALKPVVEKFPDSISGRIQWKQVTDAIVGPAAQAALETIAAHQAEFLGDSFDADIALGAVTQALLLEAAENGLKDQASRDGLIGLYQAVIGVAATRPELFIEGGQPREALAREALKSFADVLANSNPPFNRQTGVALASAAIEVVGANAHRFADPQNNWHGVALKVFKNLTVEFTDALAQNGNLKQVLSRDQFVDIGRIVLNEISHNPTLITESNDEWHGVIRTVTSAMAADTKLLLTSEDWKEIARVAAIEAATNPARLFKLEENQGNPLATDLITALLTGAANALALPNGAERTVLAGAVLRDAIVFALQSAAGNAQSISKHLERVIELIDELNQLAVEKHLEIGSKEWLHLFRALLGSALDGTKVGNLDIDRATKLLQGG